MIDFFKSIGEGIWGLTVENKKEVFLILFGLFATGIYGVVTGGFKKIGSWLWQRIENLFLNLKLRASMRKEVGKEKSVLNGASPEIIPPSKPKRNFDEEPIKVLLFDDSEIDTKSHVDGKPSIVQMLQDSLKESASDHEQWLRHREASLNEPPKAYLRDKSGMIVDVLEAPVLLLKPGVRKDLWLRERRQKRMKFKPEGMYKTKGGMVLKMVGTQEDYILAEVLAGSGLVTRGTYSLYRQGSKYSHTHPSDDWMIVSEIKE